VIPQATPAVEGAGAGGEVEDAHGGEGERYFNNRQSEFSNLRFLGDLRLCEGTKCRL